MEQTQARQILSSCITKDYALVSDSGLTHGVWIRWACEDGPDKIHLRGQLTSKELQAIGWWVSKYANRAKRQHSSTLLLRTTEKIRNLVIEAYNPQDSRWLLTCHKSLIGKVTCDQMPPTSTIRAILVDAGIQLPPESKRRKKIPTNE